jgi:hypothetical protein
MFCEFSDFFSNTVVQKMELSDIWSHLMFGFVFVMRRISVWLYFCKHALPSRLFKIYFNVVSALKKQTTALSRVLLEELIFSQLPYEGSSLCLQVPAIVNLSWFRLVRTRRYVLVLSSHSWLDHVNNIGWRVKFCYSLCKSSELCCWVGLCIAVFRSFLYSIHVFTDLFNPMQTVHKNRTPIII